MTNKIIKFINPSKQYTIFNSVDIIEKDPLPENVSLEQVIYKIENILPRYMFHGIDVVYIGYFQELADRQANAMYKDGALYLTNEQSSNDDIIDDIVHEIAHALEEKYGAEIYADNSVESEFLMKRKKLESILRNHGVDTSGYNFLQTAYTKEFDEYLYLNVGYAKLNTLSQGLFSSAYGITSLREYFATGFTDFFMNKSGNDLRSVSPVLYNKLRSLSLSDIDK